MVQLLEKLEFEKSFRLHQSHSLVSVPMRFESISICLKSLQICKTWLQSLKKACKQFPKLILQRRQRSLSVISQYFLQIFHRSNVILSGPFHSWYYSTVLCFSHIISNVKYFQCRLWQCMIITDTFVLFFLYFHYIFFHNLLRCDSNPYPPANHSCIVCKIFLLLLLYMFLNYLAPH